ncbi:MAG: DMT family transporter [Chloroflexota bacterium]
MIRRHSSKLEESAPILALLGVTAVWGWTFVIVRDAIAHYPVLPFLALRFSLAALVLAPVLVRRRSGFFAGLLPGVALAAGYLAQTAGLRLTTASQAGLLTGLFVVITPILVFLLAKARPHRATGVAAGASLLGIALLVAGGSLQPGSTQAAGDGLEVLTALAFSIHIVLLSRFSQDVDAASMAFSQMVVCGVLFDAGSVVNGGFPAPSTTVWGAILLTALLASALAFLVQTRVQQRVSPSRTAVILTAEPAFATFFGLVLEGDRFGVPQGIGAALILGAIVYHEVSLSRWNQPDAT